MSYPDNSTNSVHSLLALLRSAQDGSSQSQSQSQSTQGHASISAPAGIALDSSARPARISGAAQRSSIPTKRQLDDLLSSLNARPPPTATPPRERGQLIEPFGPVGKSPTQGTAGAGPVTPSHETPPVTSDTGRNGARDAHLGRKSSQGHENVTGAKRRPADRVNEEGYKEMSFIKALPILTELLEDETFKAELRKMKKEQDSLERRLWAKGEKVKAEHERSIQADKEVAKIARRPIPPEKKTAWASALSSALDRFHTDQCLPAIDGLAARQGARLEALGVPGLSEANGMAGDEKVRERVRRIMELLEAGLEE